MIPALPAQRTWCFRSHERESTEEAAPVFYCAKCGFRGIEGSAGAGMKVISGLWHGDCGYVATSEGEQ